MTDFDAADHALDCLKQKCLVPLRCELCALRDEATAAAQDGSLQPLMTLLQDAITLGKFRNTLAEHDFTTMHQKLGHRLE